MSIAGNRRRLRFDLPAVFGREPASYGTSKGPKVLAHLISEHALGPTRVTVRATWEAWKQ
jgi:hypothetical protein